MKMYLVEMTVLAVVVAQDETQAIEIAYKNSDEILRDCGEPAFDVCGTVKRLSDLRDGWDGACCPYGDGTDSTIADLLPKMDN